MQRKVEEEERAALRTRKLKEEKERTTRRAREEEDRAAHRKKKADREARLLREREHEARKEARELERQALRSRQSEERRLRRKALRAQNSADHDAEETRRDARPTHRHATGTKRTRSRTVPTASDLRDTLQQRQRVGSASAPSASALPSLPQARAPAQVTIDDRSYAEVTQDAPATKARLPPTTAASPRSRNRSAPITNSLFDTLLTLETQAQELYRYVVRNREDEEVAARADDLAQALTEARRQATVPARPLDASEEQEEGSSNAAKRIRLLQRRLQTALPSATERGHAD